MSTRFPLVDYHVHTDVSFDCKVPMMTMCQRAVRLGVAEIAFTDHFNNHMFDLDLGFYNPDRYFEEIGRCRAAFPNLRILAGIEVGEIHHYGHKVMSVLAKYPFDVVLGSVHWVGQESLFSPNYYRARTPARAYEAYFEELLMMIEHGGFDILAHVDLPKRVGVDVYGPFNSAQFEKNIRRVWEACIRKRITPEINTKGVRSPARELHPTAQALAWYVEMGGKTLTIGSDAHHPDSIADHFDAAWEAAAEAGITHTCRFRGRKIELYDPLPLV